MNALITSLSARPLAKAFGVASVKPDHNSLFTLMRWRSACILFALGCLALCPMARAVVPAPDGGYPNFNTAEGSNALKNLTTGVGNAAVGSFSLFSNTSGSFNTALGAGTLLSNVGDQNTGFGIQNTAIGALALFSNATGSQNTATGALALLSNTTGVGNMANGYSALYGNTTGFFNSATGADSLANNTTGAYNTANGYQALGSNTTGYFNTALGHAAGANIITGQNNVCIGAMVYGVDGVNDTTWIGNVYDSVTTARQVYVNADNKIGTLSSSRRFKENIQPMDRSSETLFALKPVTFRYKKDVDPSQALSFGLIAEDVAQVSPELITRDEEGKPQTVRYEAVNAMLLNEFLKEHNKNEVQAKTIAELKSTVAQQQRAIEQLGTQMQKVSAQVQLNGAPAIAANP
jgi:uncharacterized coiled-coil protein SlyX